MKLVYPALSTAALLLTASPSFGLSPEEIANLGIDPGLITLVVNVTACFGIVSLVFSTIAMAAAIRKAMGFSRFWDKFKFMLYASLGFPTSIIFVMASAGFMFGWTNLLYIATGLNFAFICASIPYMAFIVDD